MKFFTSVYGRSGASFDSCKKFWSFMEGLRNDFVDIPTITSNGTFESDNLVKANILND